MGQIKAGGVPRAQRTGDTPRLLRAPRTAPCQGMVARPGPAMAVGGPAPKHPQRQAKTLNFFLGKNKNHLNPKTNTRLLFICSLVLKPPGAEVSSNYLRPQERAAARVDARQPATCPPPRSLGMLRQWTAAGPAPGVTQLFGDIVGVRAPWERGNYFEPFPLSLCDTSPYGAASVLLSAG